MLRRPGHVAHVCCEPTKVSLTPFEGASYYNAAGETEREAVHHWIRTSGAFDGVIELLKDGR
jgi:hypothetical protein